MSDCMRVTWKTGKAQHAGCETNQAQFFQQNRRLHSSETLGQDGAMASNTRRRADKKDKTGQKSAEAVQARVRVPVLEGGNGNRVAESV